jgi:hypothetical protein
MARYPHTARTAWSDLRSALHSSTFDDVFAQLETVRGALIPPEFDQLLSYVYSSMPGDAWRHDPEMRHLLQRIEVWTHPDAAALIVAQKRYHKLEKLRFDKLVHSSLSWTIFRDIPWSTYTERTLGMLLTHMPNAWIYPLLMECEPWRATLMRRLATRHDLPQCFTSAQLGELCSTLAPSLLVNGEHLPLSVEFLLSLCAHSSHAYDKLHDTLSSPEVFTRCIVLDEPSRSTLLDALGLRHRLEVHLAAQPTPEPPQLDMEAMVTRLRAQHDWRARRAMLCAHRCELTARSMSDSQWERVLMAMDHAPRHEERLRLLSLIYKCGDRSTPQPLRKVMKVIRPWTEDGSLHTPRSSHRRRRRAARHQTSKPLRAEAYTYPPWYDEDRYYFYDARPAFDYHTFRDRFDQLIDICTQNDLSRFALSHVDEQFVLDHIDAIPDTIDQFHVGHLRGAPEAIHALFTAPRVLACGELLLDMSHQWEQYIGFSLRVQYIYGAALHNRAKRRAAQALGLGYAHQLCLAVESWMTHQPEARAISLSLRRIPPGDVSYLLESVLSHPTLTQCALRGVEDPIRWLAHVSQDPRAARLTSILIERHEFDDGSHTQDVQRLDALLTQPHCLHSEVVSIWRERLGLDE